jgi:hypothetical protein
MVRWPVISQRILGRQITGLEYDKSSGYLQICLDDGSRLLVASCWEEGCHVVLDTLGKRCNGPESRQSCGD